MFKQIALDESRVLHYCLSTKTDSHLTDSAEPETHRGQFFKQIHTAHSQPVFKTHLTLLR